jgi:hypothetical protein
MHLRAGIGPQVDLQCGRGRSAHYFLKAVEGVRENKQRYAEAEAQALLKPKPSMSGISSFVMRQLSARESGGE